MARAAKCTATKVNTQDIAITLAGLIYICTAASKLTVRARVGLEAAAERLPHDEVEGLQDDTSGVQESRP